MIDAMAATIENQRDPNVIRLGVGDIAVATPAGLRRIVVPVDGSPFGERALPVATWVSQALGTPIHLVEMVARPARTEPAIQYLDRSNEMAIRVGVDHLTVRAPRPSEDVSGGLAPTPTSTPGPDR